MWCPDTGHVISAAIGTNPRAATKEERAKKKKLRKSLQFGKRPILPRRRPFWSVKWHMCAILIVVDADILFVDRQLLNSCARSWNKFFPGKHNKDELPYIRNLNNSSANTLALEHYFIFFTCWKDAHETLSTKKIWVFLLQWYCKLNSHLQFWNKKFRKSLSSTRFHSVKPKLLLGWLLFPLSKCKTST